MIGYQYIIGQYQLFNKDFEEWVEMPTSGGTVKYLTPYGDIWATSNEASMVFLSEPCVDRTTDAYNGTYAAKIKTVQLGTSKGSGTLFTGKFKIDVLNPLNSTRFGIPYTDKPLFFKGFYKFMPVDGDSCRIASYLTKWNATNKSRDTIAAASITRQQSITATSTYKEFDIFYKYYKPATVPDSLSIILASSADGANFNAAIGTTLIIDAISLEYYPLSVNKLQKDNAILAYPSPIEDMLTIESNETTIGQIINIYSDLGSLIITKKLSSSKEQISFSGLPTGIYYYSIDKKDGKIETGKLLKK